MTDKELNRKCAELDGACVHDWAPVNGKIWRCKKCFRLCTSPHGKPSAVDKCYLAPDVADARFLARKLGMEEYMKYERVGYKTIVTVLPGYFSNKNPTTCEETERCEYLDQNVSRAFCHALIMAEEIKRGDKNDKHRTSEQHKKRIESLKNNIKYIGDKKARAEQRLEDITMETMKEVYDLNSSIDEEIRLLEDTKKGLSAYKE